MALFIKLYAKNDEVIKMSVQSPCGDFYSQAANAAAQAYGVRAYASVASANGSQVRQVKNSILYQAPLFCVKAPGMLMSKVTGYAAKAAVYLSSATWSWLKTPVASSPEILANDSRCAVVEKLAISAWRGTWRPVSDGCRSVNTWAIDRVQSLIVPESDTNAVVDESMMARMDQLTSTLDAAGMLLTWLKQNDVDPSKVGISRAADWFKANAKWGVAGAIDAQALTLVVDDLRDLCENSKQLLAIEPKLHQLATAMRRIAHEEFSVPLGRAANDRISQISHERQEALANLSELRQRRRLENEAVAARQQLIAPANAAPQGWASRLGGFASSLASSVINAGTSASESLAYNAQVSAIVASSGFREAGWRALSTSVSTSVSLVGELGNKGLSVAREVAKRKVAIKVTQLTAKIILTGGFQLLAWYTAFSSFGQRHICSLESNFMPTYLLQLQGCHTENDEFFSAKQMISLALMVSSLVVYRDELSQWSQKRQNARVAASFVGNGLDSILPQPHELIAKAATMVTTVASAATNLGGIPIGPNLERFNQRSLSEMNHIFAVEPQSQAVLANIALQPVVAPLYDKAIEESRNEMPD